jgi:hypothetical protein
MRMLQPNSEGGAAEKSALLRNSRPFLIAWLLFLLLVMFAGSRYAKNSATLDFQAFYTAGHLLRSHASQIYDLALQKQEQAALTSGFLPFYHPVYEAALFAPLSLLPYWAAYLTFIAVNLILFMVAFFLARPLLSPLTPVWQSRASLLPFFFVPLLLVFVQGQDSILSILLYCLAWRQLESKNDLRAAALLALALFKFQFALPFALLVAIRRGWRFAAGFLLASAAIVSLCLAIVGVAGAASYVHLLSGVTSSVDKTLFAQTMSPPPRAMPNLAGLVYACGGRFLPSSMAFNAISGLCSLALFAWSARAMRRVDLKTAFAIALLCSLLTSYHFGFYDLTLLLLPIALLAGGMNRYLLAALFVVPGVVLLGFGINWAFLVAVPVLAALIHTIVFSPKPAKPLAQALAA